MKTTHQKRFRGTKSVAAMLELGFLKSGTAQQTLIYLRDTETESILRDEGDGVFHFTQVGTRREFAHGTARVEDVDYRSVDEEEAKKIKNQHGVLFYLKRTRTIFGRTEDEVQVNVDGISYLGEFVEIRAASEERIDQVAALLGLNHSENELIDESYGEMMISKKHSEFTLKLMRLHHEFEDMTYGIVSGVMTAVAMVLGATGDTTTAAMMILMLVALAFADSWSDGLGQFRAELTKWSSDTRDAIRLALMTMIGKIFFPLLFALLFALFPMPIALASTAILMTFIIGGHAYVEAIATARSPIWHPILMVLLSFVGVLLTKIAIATINTWEASSGLAG